MLLANGITSWNEKAILADIYSWVCMCSFCLLSWLLHFALGWPNRIHILLIEETLYYLTPLQKSMEQTVATVSLRHRGPFPVPFEKAPRRREQMTWISTSTHVDIGSPNAMTLARDIWWAQETAAELLTLSPEDMLNITQAPSDRRMTRSWHDHREGGFLQQRCCS